jgi:cytochrome c-type biogenesis protein CcsB
MGLAGLSQYLFIAGSICLVVGFLMHVAHTTVLAAGRRTAAALSLSRPLTAGAATGGGTATVTLAGPSGRASGNRSETAAANFQTTTTAGSIGIGMTWTGASLIALSMLIRAYIVGRGPWGNMYEFTVAFAFGIVAGYLFLQRRYPIRTIGFLPLGVALFLIGYATTLPSNIDPLVPALQNPPLITIHVAMAMISYGIFATSFGAAVAYLAQGRTDRFSWLPGHKVLDEVAYRAVIIGFPIFATLIILGSWWASIAWGRYWGWDPKETAALVTWLIYAVYLHARNQKGWAGRPSALILVVGFGALMFTYFGNLFFAGLHSYSGL